MKSIISAKNLGYSYRKDGGIEVPVLHHCNFEIRPGEFVVFQGPSGSGKSTLLYLLGCMNTLQTGRLEMDGVQINELSSFDRALFRNRHIGFVFQQFHLLPRSSVLQNILLPSQYPVEIANREDRTARANELIASLSLKGHEHYQPHQLSGGQQQRVAIARALLNDPEIILADEPTGNLDSKNSLAVMAELKRLNRTGKTLVIISHDREIALQADRVFHIHDGTIEREEILRPDREKEIVEKSGAPASQDFYESVRSVKNAKKKNRLSRLRIPLFSELASILPFASVNLFRNRTRSLLTMLGVVIGVAAVIAMVTTGDFAKEKILAGYSELGVNTMHFYGYRNWQQKASDHVGLTFSSFKWDRDLLPLKEIFPEIIRMSPMLRSQMVILSFGGKTIDSDAAVNGVTEDVFPMAGMVLKEGIPLLRHHIDSQNAVCVIGPEVAERLFAPNSPLGEIMSVSESDRRYICKVIGVLSPRSTRSQWKKPNLDVFVPYTYYEAVSSAWWASETHDVLLQLREKSPVEKVGRGIEGFFEGKYGNSGKFRMDSDSILIEQMTRFLNIFSGFLAAVACLSLLVGGVGITNMMLVSVSERFREIGLRKALGASDMSIRWQFLLESVLLSSLAGIVGVIAGFAGYEALLWVATGLMSNLKFAWIVDWTAVFFAAISIIIVGILSGIAPAVRAEKLSPMEALRSD